MTNASLLVVCLVAVVAAWDAFRRYVEAKRFNAAALERLDKVERETHAVLSKVQAQQAAAASRAMPRIGRG